MNPEPLLTTWLRARYSTSDVKRVVTERPAVMDSTNLPLIQVVSIGGQDPEVEWGGGTAGFARRNVDLDVFALTRDGARDLAERVNADLLDSLPGAVVNDALVVAARSILAPMWVADDNTNLRRFTLSVSLYLQEQS